MDHRAVHRTEQIHFHQHEYGCLLGSAMKAHPWLARPPRRAPLINAAMYAAGSSCVAQPGAGGRGDPVNSATDPRGFIAALLVIKMERSVLF
jgi:hypothetical protein